MIRAAIVGVTGYTGYELYRLLRSHPDVELAWLTSESYAGQGLGDVFPGPWDEPLVSLAAAELTEPDVVFLCLPHGASMQAVADVRAAGTRAIDLSADFRLFDVGAYERWYGIQHAQPHLLAEAVYGLPELYRADIAGSRLVANPGCYPTSVILGLWPLAQTGWLEGRVIVDSKSGVSGAGRKPKLNTSFVEANENLSPYSIGYAHRHIGEMEQELGAGNLQFIFSPHLLPVSRGILSTMYVGLPAHAEEMDIRAAYEVAYGTEPFVHLLPRGEVATLRHTTYTNRCAIGLSLENQSHTLIVTSSLDNLVKGAAGQAVQNMNVMFGLRETTGLGLNL
jgi:N-acetyl-gamma-glutamyl-phosphate reductase